MKKSIFLSLVLSLYLFGNNNKISIDELDKFFELKNEKIHPKQNKVSKKSLSQINQDKKNEISTENSFEDFLLNNSVDGVKSLISNYIYKIYSAKNYLSNLNSFTLKVNATLSFGNSVKIKVSKKEYQNFLKLLENKKENLEKLNFYKNELNRVKKIKSLALIKTSFNSIKNQIDSFILGSLKKPIKKSTSNNSNELLEINIDDTFSEKIEIDWFTADKVKFKIKE